MDGVCTDGAAGSGYITVCWSFGPMHFLQTRLHLKVLKNCYSCRESSQLMQRLDSDQALFQGGQGGRTEVREHKGLVKFR